MAGYASSGEGSPIEFMANGPEMASSPPPDMKESVSISSLQIMLATIAQERNKEGHANVVSGKKVSVLFFN